MAHDLSRGRHDPRPLTDTQRRALLSACPAAEHLAPQLRQAIPAIALTPPPCTGEAGEGDFSLAQQVYCIGQNGDMVVVLGQETPALVNAVLAAKGKGLPVIALTSGTSEILTRLADTAHPLADASEFPSAVRALSARVTALTFENDTRRTFPANIGMVVFDFDGVFTDNKVITFQDGREAVNCDRRDSLGLNLLKKAGVPMMILSTETNPVVSARGRKLGLPVEGGCGDKASYLRSMFASRGILPESVIYLGNDLNDLEAMTLVGYPVAPSDAHPDILRIAAHVLQTPGGHGAVREFCEYALQHVTKVR